MVFSLLCECITGVHDVITGVHDVITGVHDVITGVHDVNQGWGVLIVHNATRDY